MFQEISQLIAELRPKPPPARHEAADGHALEGNRREDCASLSKYPANLSDVFPSNWLCVHPALDGKRLAIGARPPGS
jgi:hypothetical protein